MATHGEFNRPADVPISCTIRTFIGTQQTVGFDMAIDLRPTISAPDDDPYLWLEDIEGARPLGWVETQNAATMARFGGLRFAEDRDILAAILDRSDNIPYIGRRGSLIYNFWKDANNPRGLWRSTTFGGFRENDQKWDVLLDLDKLAAQENEDWIWQGALTLPPDHEVAILRLSRGGSDAAVLREFNLRVKGFVPDGFMLPEAKGGADWIDRDTCSKSRGAKVGRGSRVQSAESAFEKALALVTPKSRTKRASKGKANTKKPISSGKKAPRPLLTLVSNTSSKAVTRDTLSLS